MKAAKSRATTRSAAGSAKVALERGRAAYEAHRWRDAFESLAMADREAPLAGDDLERLAWSAALSGHDDEQIAAFERLYQLRLDAGENLAAVRAAFWLGLRLSYIGETGRGTGWFGRSERLAARADPNGAERGYALLPEIFRLLTARDGDAACTAAVRAAEIGDRFGDLDLATLARNFHGRALIQQGRHEAGLAVLDEAMLAVTKGALFPVTTGLVYCSVIDCCRRLYAVERAREWTEALARWCDAQPQLTPFTGHCRVHRSEILQLQGAWREALEEAERAAEKLPRSHSAEAAADASYQKAEIHRLRGEYPAAEEAYRNASRLGREPQPGLALLRLARGDGEAAAAAIRHVVGATREAFARTRYLPAAVEILLAADDVEGARGAARNLEEIAASARNEILDAMAAHARGAVSFAEGDAQAAIEPLRDAFATWRQIGAPYLAARMRVQIALAYRTLGDRDGARMELDAARTVFRELGAAPDLARIDALDADESSHRPFGLTPRELEVLRLVASGKTNKAISSELFVSEKTIDRHVSNIFNKIDVNTRAAATAFAYQHQLLQRL